MGVCSIPFCSIFTFPFRVYSLSIANIMQSHLLGIKNLNKYQQSLHYGFENFITPLGLDTAQIVCFTQVCESNSQPCTDDPHS